MKKVAVFLLILVIIVLLGAFTACDTTYDIYYDLDGFEMGYSAKYNDAFAYHVYWNGDVEEGIYITVPDTFRGAPVTALGGFTGIGVPCGFQILFGDKNDGRNSTLYQYLFGDVSYHYGYSCDLASNTKEEVYNDVQEYLEKVYLVSNVEIKDVVVNLHFGQNLQKVEKFNYNNFKSFHFYTEDEDETVIVYAISYVISVDEQNQYFYSDELGRMYYKENGALVSEFLYHNRDAFPEGSIAVQ